MNKITAWNLDQFIEQQVFDAVVTHLYTQGKPSVSENGDCCYRSPDGLMCAAGIFLEDDVALKNQSATWRGIVDSGLAKENHIELINNCQSAHDDAAHALRYDSVNFMERVEFNLQRIARDFNLSFNPPKATNQ